jgi:hypothetical protein
VRANGVDTYFARDRSAVAVTDEVSAAESLCIKETQGVSDHVRISDWAIDIPSVVRGRGARAHRRGTAAREHAVGRGNSDSLLGWAVRTIG